MMPGDLARGCRSGAAATGRRQEGHDPVGHVDAARERGERDRARATGRREARSIATAPPSDQPADDDPVGLETASPDQVIVGRIGRVLASPLRGLAAAHPVTHVFGDEHVEAQPPEPLELVLASFRHIALP